MAKFVIEPHFRLQEWVAEEKGYFRAEGLDYEFRELIRSTEGQHHNKVNEGAFQSIEKGRKADVSCACHWTVNVAASQRPRQALCRRLFGRAVGHLRAGGFEDPHARPISPACRSRSASSPAATIRRSRRSSSTCAAAEIKLTFEDGMLFRRMELLFDGKSAGGRAVQRAVLSRRAARLPQDHRHHLHDRGHDQRRSRPGGHQALLPRAEEARSATSTCGPSSTPTTTRTNSPTASTPIMDTRRWGPGRAHRVRALHARGLRAVVRMDRAARHLRGRHDGCGQLRFGDRIVALG